MQTKDRKAMIPQSQRQLRVGNVRKVFSKEE